MQFATLFVSAITLATSVMALPQQPKLANIIAARAEAAITARSEPIFSCPFNPNGSLFLGGCCDPTTFENGRAINVCDSATRSFDGKGFEIFTCDKSTAARKTPACCHSIVYGGGPGNPPAKGAFICEQTAILA
jgi:hypothetical protein